MARSTAYKDAGMGHFCMGCDMMVPLWEWLYIPNVIPNGAFIHIRCRFAVKVPYAEESDQKTTPET